jgi:hypothetical protein
MSQLQVSMSWLIIIYNDRHYYYFVSSHQLDGLNILDDPDDWLQLWLIVQLMSRGGMRWMGELEKKDRKRIVPKHSHTCITTIVLDRYTQCAYRLVPLYSQTMHIEKNITRLVMHRNIPKCMDAIAYIIF